MESELKGQKLVKFISYIEQRGAIVLEPTNPFEVIRFRVYGDLNIIYKNKHGYLTFSGAECEPAFNKWKAGKNWSPLNRKRANLSARKLKLANRDGKFCFFCLFPFENLIEATIEHLLSFVHGGSDNINNLVLACQPCNKALGHMAIADKIRFRDMKLAEREDK